MKNIIKNTIIVVGFIVLLTLVIPLKISAASKKCSASGCNRTATRGNYCSTHGCAECGSYRNNGSVYCNYHASIKLSNRKDVCLRSGCYRAKATGSSYCSEHTIKTTSNSSKTTSSRKKSYNSSSKSSKYEMPDCDDYEGYDDFMDDWDGCMPDGSDAEDYWEDW